MTSDRKAKIEAMFDKIMASKGDTVTITIEIDDESPEKMVLWKKLQERYPQLEIIEDRKLSFEEQYWKGLIIFGDAPYLVKGWKQTELAEQYHFDSDEQPTVHITRQNQ